MEHESIPEMHGFVKRQKIDIATYLLVFSRKLKEYSLIKNPNHYKYTNANAIYKIIKSSDVTKME